MTLETDTKIERHGKQLGGLRYTKILSLVLQPQDITGSYSNLGLVSEPILATLGFEVLTLVHCS